MIASFKKEHENKQTGDISKSMKTLIATIESIDKMNVSEIVKEQLKKVEIENFNMAQIPLQQAIKADSDASDSKYKLLSWLKKLENVNNDTIVYSNAIHFFGLIDKVTRIYENQQELIIKVCPNFKASIKKIFALLSKVEHNLHSVNNNKSIYYSDIFSISDAASLVVAIHHSIISDEEIMISLYGGQDKRDVDNIYDFETKSFTDCSLKEEQEMPI